MPSLVKAKPTVIRSGQIVKYERARDAMRRRLTDGPSPEKMASTLLSVDNGDIAALCEIQEEMESKDSHLQGIANTRRRGLTALPWDVVPDTSRADSGLAKEAAVFVRESLLGIPTWEDVLEHMALGIGPNVSVIEMIWEAAEVVDFVCVPCHRLTGAPFDQGPGVYIETNAEPLGTAAFPGKFIVHHPLGRPSFPFHVTLTHATVRPWLVRHFTMSDWMAFSELYGVPMRLAILDQQVTDETRTDVQDMFDQMGSDLAGVFGEGTDIKFLQADGAGETFQNQMEHAKMDLSILWLGQTLTTDIGDRGSFAAAKVHDNVRADLLLSDIRSEARTLRDQLFRVMVGLRFPGRDVPAPHFVRQLNERRNIEAERADLEQMQFILDRGLAVDVDEMYRKTKLTKPDSVSDDVIEGTAQAEGDDGEADEETDRPVDGS